MSQAFLNQVPKELLHLLDLDRRQVFKAMQVQPYPNKNIQKKCGQNLWSSFRSHLGVKMLVFSLIGSFLVALLGFSPKYQHDDQMWLIGRAWMQIC